MTLSTGPLRSSSCLEESVVCCNNSRFLLACAQRPTSKLQTCTSACSWGFPFPAWWQQHKCLSSCLPGRPQRVKLKTLFKVSLFLNAGLKSCAFQQNICHLGCDAECVEVMHPYNLSQAFQIRRDSDSYFFYGSSMDNNKQTKRICRQ